MFKDAFLLTPCFLPLGDHLQFMFLTPRVFLDGFSKYYFYYLMFLLNLGLIVLPTYLRWPQRHKYLMDIFRSICLNQNSTPTPCLYHLACPGSSILASHTYTWLTHVGRFSIIPDPPENDWLIISYYQFTSLLFIELNLAYFLQM